MRYAVYYQPTNSSHHFTTSPQNYINNFQRIRIIPLNNYDISRYICNIDLNSNNPRIYKGYECCWDNVYFTYRQKIASMNYYDKENGWPKAIFLGYL